MESGICYVDAGFGKPQFYLSAEEEGKAIFLLALKPLQGFDSMEKQRVGLRWKKNRNKSKQYDSNELASGPQKLCAALNISKDINNEDITTSHIICLESGDTVSYNNIVRDTPFIYYIDCLFVSQVATNRNL